MASGRGFSGMAGVGRMTFPEPVRPILDDPSHLRHPPSRRRSVPPRWHSRRRELVPEESVVDQVAEAVGDEQVGFLYARCRIGWDADLDVRTGQQRR